MDESEVANVPINGNILTYEASAKKIVTLKVILVK